MKKIVIISLFLLFALLESCKKESEHTIGKVEVHVTMQRGATFSFELKSFIRAGEFPLITKPPNNFRTSRINYSDNKTGPFYEFIPLSPAGSKETLVIKILREHDHNPLLPDDHQDNDEYTSTIITIDVSIN